MQQGMPQFSDEPLLGPLPPQSRQQRPRQGGQHSAQSKADGKRDVSQRVLCPPERYISVPTTDLQEAFRGVLHYRWNPYTRSAEHHWLTRKLIPGQFSPEDFERFTDICKLFEANSRLDFITVSRCLSVPQLYSMRVLQFVLLAGLQTPTCHNCVADVCKTTSACFLRQLGAYLCQ